MKQAALSLMPIGAPVARERPPERQPLHRHAWMLREKVRLRRARLGDEAQMSDADKQLARLLDQLQEEGLDRLFVVPDSCRDILALCKDWPNFREVTLSVAGHVALQTSPGAAPMGLPPMLLVGPPGIGKTSFVAALATACGVPSRVIPMSSLSAGFALAGLDRGWSSGRPGELFEVMRQNPQANPMVVLDEIDKAQTDPKSAPLGPLYQLLEAGTAAAFIDEYVGVPMDLRSISWVATANTESDVPTALLSRMTVFQVKAPTPSQLQIIVRRQYRELQSHVPALEAELSEAVVSRLCQLGPRSARSQLRAAAGHAALRCQLMGRERIRLLPSDLTQAEAPQRPMGFY